MEFRNVDDVNKTKKGKLTYLEAREIVQEKKLRTTTMYRAFVLSNPNLSLPKYPNKAYKNKGWTIWEEFLYERYFNYSEAQTNLKLLGLRTNISYFRFLRSNHGSGFHWTPPRYYKEWTTWEDYFDNKELKTYVDFESAKKIVQENAITCQRKYQTFRKDNPELRLPRAPSYTYKNKGWISLYNFFNKVPLTSYAPSMSYKEAQKFCTSNGLNTRRKYYKYVKNNPECGLPIDPKNYFKKKWLGYGIFFGTNAMPKFLKSFLPYNEARKLVRSLELKSAEQYYLYVHENPHSELPSAPYQTYDKYGWISWGHYAGVQIGRMCDKIPLTEAKDILKDKNLSSVAEYIKFIKRNKKLCLAARPDIVYKNAGWSGWNAYLNKERSKKSLKRSPNQKLAA